MARKTRKKVAQSRPEAGRPHTLESEEFIEEFTGNLTASGSLETAISLSGIGRETFYGWRREWEAQQAGRIELPEKTVEMYAGFFRQVDVALARHKLVREKRMQQAGEKDWRADAWWLSRKGGEEYVEPRHRGDEKPGADETPKRIVWVPVKDQDA